MVMVMETTGIWMGLGIGWDGMGWGMEMYRASQQRTGKGRDGRRVWVWVCVWVGLWFYVLG